MANTNQPKKDLTYSQLMKDLAQKESSDRYWVENKSGYLGLYQMGERALIDAGYYKGPISKGVKQTWSGTWTGKDGITSKAAFLNSSEIQTKAIKEYMNIQWGYAEYWGGAKPGMVINGIELTESGILAASHLVGAKGFSDYVTSNGKIIPRDGNKVSAEVYLKKFAGYETPFSPPKEQKDIFNEKPETLQGQLTKTRSLQNIFATAKSKVQDFFGKLFNKNNDENYLNLSPDDINFQEFYDADYDKKIKMMRGFSTGQASNLNLDDLPPDFRANLLATYNEINTPKTFRETLVDKLGIAKDFLVEKGMGIAVGVYTGTIKYEMRR